MPCRSSFSQRVEIVQGGRPVGGSLLADSTESQMPRYCFAVQQNTRQYRFF